MPMFFTADLHYGHDNIVKHCRRPVMSPDEVALLDAGEDFKVSPETRARHHDYLVGKVNDAVGRDDVLWVLGDCCSHQAAEEFRDRVRCRDVRLVRGNHDSPRIEGIFTQVHDLFPLVWGEHTLVLCHYPMKSWWRSHRGSYQLHGHVHGKPVSEPWELQLDVGVDGPRNYPWSLQEVIELMQRRRPLWEEWRSEVARQLVHDTRGS